MKNESIIKTSSTILLISTIGLSILTGGLVYYTSKNIDNINLRFAPVTSISIEETPVVDEESVITLHGALPNSCWKLEFHEIHIYASHKLVVITLWASYTYGACLDIILYFHYNVSVYFPSSGNWEISCNRISINVIVLD
ncbi:MAG: hypothetical protein ACFE8L_13685 [Candidatus Hodarchaeota archaeon]